MVPDHREKEGGDLTLSRRPLSAVVADLLLGRRQLSYRLSSLPKLHRPTLPCSLSSRRGDRHHQQNHRACASTTTKFPRPPPTRTCDSLSRDWPYSSSTSCYESLCWTCSCSVWATEGLQLLPIRSRKEEIKEVRMVLLFGSSSHAHHYCSSDQERTSSDIVPAGRCCRGWDCCPRRCFRNDPTRWSLFFDRLWLLLLSFVALQRL
jgi:hypothetical protein